jgi:putative DNA primase/helicase
MTKKKKNNLDGAIKKLQAIKPSALVDELYKPERLEILACIEREQLAEFEKLLMKFQADGFKGITRLRKLIKDTSKSLPKPKGTSSREELLAQPIKAAQLFRNEIRPNLLYFQSEWLAWNQSHYEAIEADVVRGQIWEFLEANESVPNPYSVSSIFDALKAICIKAQGSFEPPCWLSGNEDKPDPKYIISCSNGLLNLRTGKLLKHTPDFFTRNALTFPYNRNAPKPKKWLERCGVIWEGDPDQIFLLQEYAGYSLTPSRKHDRIFLFWGIPRGGKTVTIKVLTKLVGARNVGSPTLENLGTRFGFEGLLGSTVLAISETRLGPHADRHAVLTSLLRLSGGDPVDIERKGIGGKLTKILPVVILIIGNVLPALPDESGALKARIEIIAFRKSFADSADRHMEDHFDDELPGILNWAIEGWKRLDAQGDFTRSETSAELRESMEALSTRVKPFINECCVLGQGRLELKANLWREFKDFAEARGINIHGNAQMFYADLQTASGCQLTGGPEDRYLYGIALKSDEQKRDEMPLNDAITVLADLIVLSKSTIKDLEEEIAEYEKELKKKCSEEAGRKALAVAAAKYEGVFHELPDIDDPE